MGPFYHHRSDFGPFYFTIDFNVLSFGVWVFVDVDQSVTIEFSFFCWSFGMNLFDPGIEMEEK